MSDRKLPTSSSDAQVAEFLRKVAATPAIKTNTSNPGRLIFALDATASRQPTWDKACQLQGEMFAETATLGGLAVQLAWYRGFNEFGASPWLTEAPDMLKRMSAVFCLGGMTQIERILDHVIEETRRHRVNALVFVGDCMEEKVDRLCAKAGQLGLLGVPVFIFQEGHDPVAAQAFRQMAHLSHGAYCPFDAGSAGQLRDLLNAVAIFATGGRQALEDFGRRRGGLVPRLTRQLGKT